MNDVFIYDTLRSPLGEGQTKGALHEVKPVVLLSIILDALKERNPSILKQVNDVIIGCFTPVGDQGANIAKTALLYAGWCDTIPGMQISRFSASSLEAIHIAASKIRAGWEELLIAGGIECISRVPIGGDSGPLMFDPEINLQARYLPQGIGADLLATKAGLTRADLDAFAYQSHQKAAQAQSNGYFDKAIVPIYDRNGLPLLSKDETIRGNVSLEELENLQPSFVALGSKGFDDIALMKYPAIEQIEHLHTAGNSRKLVDGVSLSLLGSAEKGKALGLTPKAKIIAIASAGSEPTIKLEGSTPAVRKALKMANLKAEDIDLWEVNESFAAPVLVLQRNLDIPDEKLNVNGGGIAIGYPHGAVGAIMLGNLVNELERRALKYGLIAMHAGAGIGMATIIERV